MNVKDVIISMSRAWGCGDTATGLQRLAQPVMISLSTLVKLNKHSVNNLPWTGKAASVHSQS